VLFEVGLCLDWIPFELVNERHARASFSPIRGEGC
jgi:hypothetical protein